MKFKQNKAMKRLATILVIYSVLLLLTSCRTAESLFDIIWREFWKTIIIVTGG